MLSSRGLLSFSHVLLQLCDPRFHFLAFDGIPNVPQNAEDLFSLEGCDIPIADAIDEPLHGQMMSLTCSILGILIRTPGSRSEGRMRSRHNPSARVSPSNALLTHFLISGSVYWSKI